jgi:hypothetical protein
MKWIKRILKEWLKKPENRCERCGDESPSCVCGVPSFEAWMSEKDGFARTANRN